jgi:hypothetical protein
MTAFELITSALRLTGVFANGEEPSDGDANQCLMVLNDMIDAWNADSLAIFTTRTDDFPFIGGQQAYTLGTGGDFNIPRPAKVTSMSAILISSGAPLEIPMVEYTVDDWQNNLPVKDVDGSFPTIWYDDGGFPLRTINFWPIPQADNVRIYSWQALAAQTLTAQVTFPPGYSEGLRYNLAIRLADEFGAPASPTVTQRAVESLATIRRINAPSPTISSDLVPIGGWNYRAELFGIGF